MTLAEKIAQLQYNAPAIERLGVPAYNWWNECLHGVARSGAATVFPQAIAMAASFDTELMYEVATAISDEARAKYNEYKNIADVSVITSVPLTEALRTKLIAKLETKLNKTVVLKEKTDASIIDGIIVEYNNKRIDNSVRAGLESLRTAMADAELS